MSLLAKIAIFVGIIASFATIVGTVFTIASYFEQDKSINLTISNVSNLFTLDTIQLLFLFLLILGFVALVTLTWKYGSSFLSSLKSYMLRIIDDIKWIDGPHSIHSFGYIISKPHNLALVGHIQLKGKNTNKSPIVVKKAYLRSLVTGEQINAEIERLEAENIEIYGGANFTVLVKFPNEDGHLAQNSISGISLESFLKRFSNFEIIIETNKKTHRIEFNSDETKEWVTSVQIGLMMPAPAEKAKVLKRV